MKVSIVVNQSGNKNSALSKKCRQLGLISEEKKLEERVKLGKILKVIRKVDVELGKVLSDEEIDMVVVSGERKGRRSKGGKVVEVEI